MLDLLLILITIFHPSWQLNCNYVNHLNKDSNRNEIIVYSVHLEDSVGGDEPNSGHIEDEDGNLDDIEEDVVIAPWGIAFLGWWLAYLRLPALLEVVLRSVVWRVVVLKDLFYVGFLFILLILMMNATDLVFKKGIAGILLSLFNLNRPPFFFRALLFGYFPFFTLFLDHLKFKYSYILLLN